MLERLKHALNDGPIRVALIVLVVFVGTRAFDHLAAEAPASGNAVEDALAKMSRGERGEIPIGDGATLNLEPVIGPDGQPLDLVGVRDTMLRLAPEALTKAEAKYGADDPRTINARGGMIAHHLHFGRDRQAAVLADRNLDIALHSESVTPEQALKAVQSAISVKDDNQMWPPHRVREVRALADRHAEAAPEQAVSVYIDFAKLYGKAKKAREAEAVLRRAVAIGDSGKVAAGSLVNVHVGLVGLALQRGDCPVARAHFSLAKAKSTEADQMLQNFYSHFFKQVESKLARCGGNDLAAQIRRIFEKNKP